MVLQLIVELGLCEWILFSTTKASILFFKDLRRKLPLTSFGK